MMGHTASGINTTEPAWQSGNHVVAKCHWDGLFDDEYMAYQLQEYLSYFSQTMLVQILQRVFDRHTSPKQTLRMETLVLDLGVLQFEDLETQLAKKIEAGLSAQLQKLLGRAEGQASMSQKSTVAQAGAAPLRLMDSNHSLVGFIHTFLLTGVGPWWYRGKRSNEQIFLQQLSDSPKELATMLRFVAKNKSARERMLWQWRVEGVEKVVVLLEPLYHRNILGFVESIINIHKRLPVVDTHSNRLKQHLMLWVLTFIILERGPQFNNAAYVKFVLKNYAFRYKLKYLALLQIIHGLGSLGDEGLSTSEPLYKVIAQLLQSEKKRPAPPSVETASSQDKFQQLEQRLLGINDSAQNKLQLTNLLVQLQLDDDAGLLKRLRKIGNKSIVQHNLATALEKQKRNSMVSLLSPGNQRFITSYAGRLEQVAVQHKQAPGLVWEVIFGYLLADNGSTLNRQQFVADTLLRLSKKHGLAYRELLAMLLHSSNSSQSAISSGSAQPFELQQILMALQKKETVVEKHAISNVDASLDSYLQAVMHYLSSGEVRSFSDHQKLPDLNQMFSMLLVHRAQQLAKLTGLLITQNYAQENAKQTFFARLENLTSGGNYRLLSHAMAPLLDEFLDTFVDQLMHWHQQGWLPTLKGFDCYQDLQLSTLYTLVSDFRPSASIAQFLPVFFSILNRQYGIESNHLKSELTQCLQKRSPVGKFDGEISQYLEASAEKQIDIGEDSKSRTGQSLIKSNKHQLLIAVLRSGKSLEPDQQQTRLAELLTSLTTAEFESFLRTAGRQIDASAIFRSLLSSTAKPLTKLLSDLEHKTGLTEANAIIELLSAALQNMEQCAAPQESLSKCLREIYALCLYDDLIGNHHPLDTTARTRITQSVILAICHDLHVPVTDFIQSLSLQNSGAKNQIIEMAIAAISASRITSIDKAESPIEGQAGSTITSDNNYSDLDRVQADMLFLNVLRHGKVPLWLNRSTRFDARRMCSELLEQQPHRLKTLVGEVFACSAAKFRLNNLLSYRQLLSAVGQTSSQSHSQLKMLDGLCQGLAQLNITGIPAPIVQAHLFQHTLRCWLKDDWRNMLADQIVGFLRGELERKFGIDVLQFNQQLSLHKSHLPATLRLSVASKLPKSNVDQLDKGQIESFKFNADTPATINQSKPIIMSQSEQQTPQLDLPITVANAGLVILQDFIKTYFDRLGLLNKSDFINDQVQRDAVHHLQYLATGHYHTEEQHLALNKLLCGVDIRSPIEPGVEADAESKATADSLIGAMIQYWSAIGSSSIDGFRGNWLLRQGSLSEHADHWELIVETKPYDLLLQQAPVSFSIIKHPWMPKPINVSWPT